MAAAPVSSNGEPSTLLPPALDEARKAQVLHACARPLIALATQLRSAVLEAPDAMRQALAAAIARFERETAAAGCDERSIAAASYLLCVWVDEVVAETPWGRGGTGLLEHFHGETDGSGKVLRLLSRLAEQPREHRALLELFHACLSLGLGGALRDAPDAARQIELLRSRVFLTLPHDPTPLAPAWHGAVPPAASPQRRRVVLGALLLLGLGAVGVYSASRMLLAARTDQVFASMQQLSEVSGARATAPSKPTLAASTPAPAPMSARLAPLLADDLAAGRISVRDEAHRSIVTLAADTLFEPGATQLRPDAADLLARIGAALARQGGKVLVVGHTDGSDPRSARLPSAWHQSFEWARAVSDSLGRALPAERLTSEGAGDRIAPGATALQRRRVDIALFP